MRPPIRVNFGPLPDHLQLARVRTDTRPLYRAETSAGVRYVWDSAPSS